MADADDSDCCSGADLVCAVAAAVAAVYSGCRSCCCCFDRRSID